MAEPYRVAIKDSVVRETPLTTDDLADTSELAFASKTDAKSWVEDLNRSVPPEAMGIFALRTAHPNDGSDADAYLTFRRQGRWVVES
jgi:hypothetical protein